MAATRDQYGLTPKEAKIALYKAQGMSQSDAYRQAYNATSKEPKTIWNAASQVFARPAVAARVRELVDAAKVQDIITVGRWAELVMDGVEQAQKDGNLTAFFNGTRQLGQAAGALKDHVSMTVEQRTDDKELIERLANGDKAALAALQKALGAKDGFDA